MRNRSLNIAGRLGWQLGVIAAWMLTCLLLPAGFWHQIISLAYLIFAPGYLLLKAIGGRHYKYQQNVAKVLFYSVGLSLISLMLIGLLLNQTYTLLGFVQPLSLKPLTYSIAASSAVLAVIGTLRQPKVKLPLPNLKLKPLLKRLAVWLGFLILPLLAVGGATTLNNGGSAWLALLVMFAIAASFILAVCQRSMTRHYPIMLYSVGLALLLGTSMRGWNITGHDIMQEYQVFQLTLKHSAWHMNYYQDAYTACLSITILPTILTRLTGIKDIYIYKFVFQLCFALIGPIMYSTLRDYVSKRTALLASLVFITFPVFLTDITMLNRQEVAILCLALAVQVALDKAWRGRAKSLLSLIFLLGMVLSHYSTSYIAVASLLTALIIDRLWRWLSRRRLLKSSKPSQPPMQLFSAPVILATTLALFAWGTIITQTSNNLAETVEGIAAAATGQLPVTHSAAAQPASTTQYQSSLTAARTLPAADYYPAAIAAKYPIKPAAAITAPTSRLARDFGLSSSLLAKFYNLMRGAYGGLLFGGIGIGLVLGLFFKRLDNLPRLYILMGVSSIIIIAAQLILPSSLINYGLTRLIQQSMLFLALPMVLAGLYVLKLLRVPEAYRRPLFGGVLALFFLILSGSLSSLTGGYKPVLALSNTGLYYQAYYTHQDEVSAAQWLDTQIPAGSHIYSDEFMRRKIIAYDDIFAQTGLVAADIPVDSYDVISHGDTEFNEIPAYDGNQVIYYQLPTAFLNSNKNLVYSSGNTLIYK
jgi:uncharacterized membrane protein